MYDVFTKIRLNLEKDNKIPSKTLLNLNPSSQPCLDISTNKNIGTCLRQIWFTKNDFEKTNIINVNNISNIAGNWYENWFINELKACNLYYNSSFSATDTSRLVKGIVDVALLNPNTNEIELGEVKSYDGSNYNNMSTILGNKNNKPAPRLKHLLQAYRYSLIFKDTIKVNNLFYIDRACSSWYKNKQFKIEIEEINKVLYPKISTVWNDEYYQYIETTVSDVGIYKAEEKLLDHFYQNTAPEKDYVEEYSEEVIKSRYEKDLIPQYLYNKYIKDPINNPIGDSECKYCPYAKGLCNKYEDSI